MKKRKNKISTQIVARGENARNEIVELGCILRTNEHEREREREKIEGYEGSLQLHPILRRRGLSSSSVSRRFDLFSISLLFHAFDRSIAFSICISINYLSFRLHPPNCDFLNHFIETLSKLLSISYRSRISFLLVFTRLGLLKPFLF